MIIHKTMNSGHWDVYFSLPPDPTDKYKYRRNKFIGVICKQLQTAINTTMAEYPEAEIHQVVRRGAADYIITDE